jgi:predicted membrane protein DUF2232
MGRAGVVGITALCGTFAAGPSLAVATGSPSSLILVILVYLSQLPLFIGGLWLGVGVALAAGVTASIMLLAASNIMAALMFAAVNVVPVILLVRQALLARTGTAGAIEWYPPGLLAAWLTGLGLTAIAVAFLLFGGADNIQLATRERLAAALDGLFKENAAGRDELAGFFAMVMPGLIAASWMAMTVINGVLAQGLLARFGASWRPSPALVTLSLPMWFPVVPVLATVATVLGGSMRFLGINMMIVLTVPFCLTGLAVLHIIAYRFSHPAILLVSFYVLAGVFGWPLLLITFLGLIDASLRLRGRSPLRQALGGTNDG